LDEVHLGAYLEVDFAADFEVELDGDSRLILTLISRLIRSRGFGWGWWLRVDLDADFQVD